MCESNHAQAEGEKWVRELHFPHPRRGTATSRAGTTGRETSRLNTPIRPGYAPAVRPGRALSPARRRPSFTTNPVLHRCDPHFRFVRSDPADVVGNRGADCSGRDAALHRAGRRTARGVAAGPRHEQSWSAAELNRAAGARNTRVGLLSLLIARVLRLQSSARRQLDADAARDRFAPKASVRCREPCCAASWDGVVSVSTTETSRIAKEQPPQGIDHGPPAAFSSWLVAEVAHREDESPGIRA
jgi:hypothetical protein